MRKRGRESVETNNTKSERKKAADHTQKKINANKRKLAKSVARRKKEQDEAEARKKLLLVTCEEEVDKLVKEKVSIHSVKQKAVDRLKEQLILFKERMEKNYRAHYNPKDYNQPTHSKSRDAFKKKLLEVMKKYDAIVKKNRRKNNNHKKKRRRRR